MTIAESKILVFPRLALLALTAGCLGGILLVLLANQLSPLIAIGLCLGIVVAIATVIRPDLALALTVFVIPIERLGRFTDDSSMYTLSLMRVVGVLALGCLVINVLIRKKKFLFGRPFFLYSGYCAIAILSITYTNDLLGAVRASGAVVANLMFFFLIINMVRSWRQVRIVIIIWLTSSVFVGGYTVYNWHYGNQSTEELEIGKTRNRFNTVLEDTSEVQSLDKVARASGTTSHPAVYGINMVLTLPFFAYLFRFAKSKIQTMVLTIGLLIVLYNILLTNTRAVLLVAIMVFVLAVFKRLIRVSPGRFIALLVICAGMLPFVPAAVYDRVLSVSNYTYERSATLRIRLEYWQAGLQIAQDNWLLGIGVGNQKTVPNYIKSITAKETSVHNEFLETLMEVGVPGWLLFFSFVGTILFCTSKAAGRYRQIPSMQEEYWFMIASQIAIIITLLFGLQVDVFHFPLKGWWLIAGLSWVMYLLSSESIRCKPHRHLSNAA